MFSYTKSNSGVGRSIETSSNNTPLLVLEKEAEAEAEGSKTTMGFVFAVPKLSDSSTTSTTSINNSSNGMNSNHVMAKKTAPAIPVKQLFGRGSSGGLVKDESTSSMNGGSNSSISLNGSFKRNRSLTKGAAGAVKASTLYYVCVVLTLLFVYLQCRQMMSMDWEMNVSITTLTNTKIRSPLTTGCHCFGSGSNNPKVALATLFSGIQSELATDEERAVVNCTRQTKINYAQRHGYSFFDEHNFSAADALPLLDHMVVGDNPLKQGRFQKLQFLIQLCEKHADIDWILWMDSDAAITDQDVTVAQKLATFQQRFEVQQQMDEIYDEEDEDEEIDAYVVQVIKRRKKETKEQRRERRRKQKELRGKEKERRRKQRKLNLENAKKYGCHTSLSMVIAHDHKGVNNGVFLIRNNEIGRRILYTSYMTYVDPTHGYADQRAMTNGVLNRTATNSTLYLNVLEVPMEEAHLLQNYAIKRIKRSHPMYWNKEKNPWTLHMPHSTTRYRKNFLGPGQQNICPWLV